MHAFLFLRSEVVATLLLRDKYLHDYSDSLTQEVASTWKEAVKDEKYNNIE